MNGGMAGLSGSLALVLLLPMEAGVPIPVPADLVMFTVGERVAAGKFPLWLAVAGFEVIAVLGTTALFLACRGPAQRIIARFGPRLGFTEARLRRAAVFAETRGRPGLALGRATPGLRRLTVIAAAVSGLNGRRALPALILGSSVFLQLHLVLGMLFGPLADRAFDRAKGPALVAAVVLVIGTVVFWRVRRRRRATASGAWMEATCPACIGVSLLAGRVSGVAGLAAPDPVRPPSRCFEAGQQVEEQAGNVGVSPGALLGRGEVELAVQLDELPLDTDAGMIAPVVRGAHAGSLQPVTSPQRRPVKAIIRTRANSASPPSSAQRSPSRRAVFSVIPPSWHYATSVG